MEFIFATLVLMSILLLNFFIIKLWMRIAAFIGDMLGFSRLINFIIGKLLKKDTF